MSAVAESTVAGKPIAAIAAVTTWEAFPSLWRKLLDEVWTAVRSEGSISPGRNVMLYHDDVPNVEIGCEVEATFEPIGRVVPSALPSGRVAMTLHRGRYEDIGVAHDAVKAWCAGHGIARAGPLWEIYGHAVPKEADQEVEIYHLLR